MKSYRAVAIVAAIVIVAAALVFAWRYRSAVDRNPVSELLAPMPIDASAVVFIDLVALRQSPFLAELYKWAPQAPADADYTQFVQSTGFNYETDLNGLGIAILKRGQDTTLFVVADGHFDRKRINAYALQGGSRESRNGREIYSIATSGNARRITYTFLRNDRIELTNDATLDLASVQPQADSDTQPWSERFRRLAGSPIFAVVRQDASFGAALDGHAPGGLQSPELSALLNELQWITVAGKPDNDRLRVVLEGEGTAESTARQLSDVVNGLLVLAQAGLSDPKLRQQLQPQVREAYLEVLKSADVSRIDRGETKAVRLVFDVTPSFLEAARMSIPASPPAPPNKRSPGRATIRN